MIALKNVLVATDFSEPSDAALAYGRELAQAFDATLHVLHVVENLAARAASDAYPMMLPTMQRDLEDAAWNRLEGILTSADRQTLAAKPVVRVGLQPAGEIVEYAREARIDLIVMGTHGRGAVAHLLMGSVAERVVRIAPCPVLTVRHPEHEFVVPDPVAVTEKA
jgi:nucleotide-binding universal stress UspA family protein